MTQQQQKPVTGFHSTLSPGEKGNTPDGTSSPHETKMKAETLAGISLPDLKQMQMVTDLLSKHRLTEFDKRMDKLDQSLNKEESRIDRLDRDMEAIKSSTEFIDNMVRT